MPLERFESTQESLSPLTIYLEARQKMQNDRDILTFGGNLLSATAAFIQSKEVQILSLPRQYDLYAQKEVQITQAGHDITISQAASDGLRYLEERKEQISPSTEEAAQRFVALTQLHSRLTPRLQRVVQSNLMHHIDNAVTTTTTTLTADPVLDVGQHLHDALRQGIPFEATHVQQLAEALGIKQNQELTAVHVATLKDSLQNAASVLQALPLASNEVLAQEISQLTHASPGYHFTEEQLQHELQNFVGRTADIYLSQSIAQPDFDWGQFADTVTALYIFNNAETVLTSHNPTTQESNIRTAVQILGFLDTYSRV